MQIDQPGQDNGGDDARNTPGLPGDLDDHKNHSSLSVLGRFPANEHKKTAFLMKSSFCIDEEYSYRARI